MLSCYRVLDLTNEKGFLCGRALGDLGADVIKIEKPGGDPARSIGPFYHDIPDPEKSLYWFAFNANKRSITLDIETADGREIFKELVKKADVVIESFAPGYMDKIGLGYSVLSQINPGIILTSISGFGQEGPYRDYKAPDIVVRALGGLVYFVGDPDRPPLIPSYPHTYLVGAMHGAVGTMVALCHRAFTGRGQWVDAPTQQGLVFVASVQVHCPWSLLGIIHKRTGRDGTPVQLKTGERYAAPLLWDCKDGSVSGGIGLGPRFAPAGKALVEWMKSEGHDLGIVGQWDWDTMTYYNLETREQAEEFYSVFRKFFMKHTMMELLEKALEKGFQIGPCLNAEQEMKFPQLVERGFWKEVAHPELGTNITYPGGFVKPGTGDCGVRFRAPLIGEHNDEVYKKELGLSTEELVALKQRRVI